MNQENTSGNLHPAEPSSPRYSIQAALDDSIAALKGNFQTVGILALVCAAGAFLTSFIFSSLMANSIIHAPLNVRMIVPGQQYMLQMLLIMAPWVILIIASQLLVSAFALSVIGVAVNNGADNKKTNIPLTVELGLQRLPRALLGIALYSGIVIAPILAAFIAGEIIDWLTTGMTTLFIILLAVSIIATLYLAVRFALMPMIALFETIPLRKMYSRAEYLISGGGVWFVVTYIVGMLALGLLLSMIFPEPHRGSEHGFLLLTIRGIIQQAIFYFIYTTTFVVFYRNRKAVRG